ncbi:MAG: HalOD1 output domain-containing protein [Haloferacaceae archaeon]
MTSTDAPEGTGRDHSTYDQARGESLTFAIVEAVARVNDVDPIDLDPLQSVVDPDALEKLVSSLEGSASRDEEWRTEFSFEGCHVEITSSGEVAVRREPPGGRGTVSTEAEFEDALAHLIREAEANGVAVDGGWACRDGSTSPTWGIEIYEVGESEQQ